MQNLKKKGLFAGFDLVDLGEELAQGAFDPTLEGGGLQGALGAGAAHAHVNRIAFDPAEFHTAAVVLCDIRVELLDQAAHHVFARVVVGMLIMVQLHAQPPFFVLG